MAHEFRLPDIGEGLTEAEVIRWLVAVGDAVAADQPLVEVETDKAVVDLPAPRAGIVLYHGAEAGEVIKVGEILAVIGDEGELWTSPGEERAPLAETLPTEREGLRAPWAPPADEPAPIVGTLPAAVEAPPELPAVGKVMALPLVRKLAQERGVDLAAVEGTGPGNRVTRDDVLAAAEAAPTVPAKGASERVGLSKLRRTIAEHMERSWREIPHVTTFDAVDGSRLLAARRALAERHATEVPLEALLVKAVLPALVEFPEFNASLDGDEVVLKRWYDVGIAVDTAEGLIVPVSRGADRATLLELAADILRLAEGARERTLAPDELTGATFTVSNIGALGGGYGTPIIPFGTTAILSVGKAEDQPVARHGAVTVAPMMPLSLSYDHRVIDGAAGRRFMARLRENLEEPALFLAG